MSNSNAVLEAIKSRRSIRKFKPDAVPKELVDQILEAGLYAPSGMGKQPVIFMAISNKDIIKKLSAVNAEIFGKEFDPFYGAPLAIVVLSDTSRPTHVQDGSLAMENLMLAAHSLGLGSCWIHRAKETFERDEWKQFLKNNSVEGSYEGVAICVIGYADMEAEAAPRQDKRVFYVD